MLVNCQECGRQYEDAECWTLCPHILLMPLQDLERKKAGLELLGKRVRFIQKPESHQSFRVIGVGWDGMVVLEGWSGEFAPHDFIECS